ncbi:hypothetical protein [Myxococcus sp. RHSTA-1-4]|uniref:hypothetical protein n=1 Tax=Myxococcus sp. RHSTA-1-4 TaxID=2874601 RepID=UPI001CBB098F|nr:hypothetical protein [Myxococcus sp. RHSTA-1-4]MBZ4423310.1 hypothetical protein [Myxococcus sp. RHSTA-1-4]
MTWSKLLEAPPPLSMTGLLAFMERWKPGSTQGFEPATADQIAALAKPHGGLDTLPRVYREFLESMGAATGGLRLMWGTTSISVLLEDLEDPQRERPDSRRYLKFAIGEDDYNGRHPDDFFELSRPTSDGRDAALLRIHEEDLVSGKAAAAQPFPTFSDLLRSVIVARVSLEAVPRKQTQYYNLGPNREAPAKAYEFFTRLGFSLTELGASSAVIPLEHPERGAIALIRAPSTLLPRAGVEVRARDKTQQALLNEVIEDHKQELSGG